VWTVETHNAEPAAVRLLGRWARESKEANLASPLEPDGRHVGAHPEPERSEAVLRRLAAR
jgi:hypothetical protein